MAYRFKRRGMGASPPGVYDCSGDLSWYLSSSCWSQPASAWAAQYASQMSAVAPPQAPTGPALTVPPASGAQAQQTVDSLVNQQMTDQQTLNAQGVQSSTSDLVLGSGGAAVAAVSSAASSPMVWLVVAGVAAFALVAMGGGSPRR